MIWRETLAGVDPERDPARIRLTVQGRVQGVGFRPGIYRLAGAAGVGGFIRNTLRGVVIEVEGRRDAVRDFARRMTSDLPPLARIDGIEAAEIEPLGDAAFRIEASDDPGLGEALFPVDTAVCGDCLREMRDASDRRHRYPFINCTNCGPRFTIIEGLPYDRPLTTMREFAMDGFCRAQYADPADRRFHAEPISCPACGPRLELVDSCGRTIAGDPVSLAQRFLTEGKILAVKGLGGYHIACLADSADPVRRLRERKRRPAKPFACMFRDLGAVLRHCEAGEVERRLLASPEAPIVLLRRSARSLPEEIAPANAYIGAFLPYTPLHHLLMEAFEVLVMTSANFTDEPLVSTEEELRAILGRIADAALVHDRRIAHACDDSILFAPAGRPVPIRRARGYVPEPLPLPEAPASAIVALGAQEKGTFALSRGGSAYVSPHLGDLGDLRGQRNFLRELADFERILGVAPKVCAHDLHPDYFTTRLAAELEVGERVAVQHHHAHAASVMAERGLPGPVVAVAFDGTGYGTDGRLWGGEFLLARYDGFERLGHLAYVPLPGGEAAIREPWRMTLVHLRRLLGDGVVDAPLPAPVSFEGLPAREVLELVRAKINSPLTSSMGRLFDAVAFLLGCAPRATYEAESAVALEALALDGLARGDSGGALPAAGTEYPWGGGDEPDAAGGEGASIDPAPVLEAILADLRRGTGTAEIAAAFHRSVAALVVDRSVAWCRRHSIHDVVLSGGVFQNRLLCELVMERSRSVPERFHQHSIVPPNDGGVSLGQLAVASAVARKG